MKCVVGWENFPCCELLWDDFIQEDIWERSQEKTSIGAYDKDVALLVKGKKKKCSNSGEMLDMDMRKVICFSCKKYGHYAIHFPNNKNNKEGWDYGSSVSWSGVNQKIWWVLNGE